MHGKVPFYPIILQNKGCHARFVRLPTERANSVSIFREMSRALTECVKAPLHNRIHGCKEMELITILSYVKGGYHSTTFFHLPLCREIPHLSCLYCDYSYIQ